MYKSGQIMPSTRENGEKIKLMEEVNFGMQTEISMKVNGKTTKLMAMVYTFT